MIISKDFEFEMAHRLDEYNGLCKNIHGHTYKLKVSLNIDKLDPLGMCIDFSTIKKVVNYVVVNKADHSIWLNNSESNQNLIKVLKKDKMRLILTPYNSTAENMVLTFWKVLSKSLPLYTLTLWETPTSSITINKHNYEEMKKHIVDMECFNIENED